MPNATVIRVKHDAKESEAFRRVLFTTVQSQLVIMSLKPGEDIGEEIHEDVDQLLYAVDGKGLAVIEGMEQPFEKGDMFCVPKGTRHNVKNIDDEPMKLFTIYAPPQHEVGTVHETKADAERAERKAATALSPAAAS